MKKILVLSLAFFALFFYGHKALAVDVEYDIQFGDPHIKERYAGSIVVANNPFTDQYWYVEPDSQERLLIKNGVTVSRLLKNFATEISTEELNKLPENLESPNVDYNLVHKFKGQFLQNNDEYWYVNTLDGYRYKIQNGEEGFDTLKDLALDISVDRLNAIKKSTNPNFASEEREVNFAIYESTMRILKNNYYNSNDIDNKEMFYGSLEGLVSSLDDPYTQFFSPRDKENFEEQIEGELEGIGAMVETSNGVLTVISPLDDSPAQKAGLLPQDQIWYVDSTDIRGFTVEDAVELIKGPSGTTVVLDIYRPSTGKYFKMTITRAKIETPSVTGQILDDNIVYLGLHMFSSSAPKELEEKMAQLIDQNTKGIILDLRNNPGGYTNSAFSIADHWLDSGDIIFQEKYPHKTFVFKDKQDREIDLPTVILVNKGTASASEILTSALKNHQAAIVVGDTTFGKGTGQTVQTFVDGSAIKYTVFEWLDSNDKNINGSGIEPDYPIQNTASQDVQLQKAKTLLR
ncbi:hypothetical protein C0580_02305 [Candidatus Parcubacteria bacterium]|nr:MAG: hypothetical protein C0580_02305 [Candidatus Parcubacteria bacterium]